MPTIYQLPMQVPGMVGVMPNQKFMVSGDSLATITTAGYLNQASLESNPVASTDIIQVLYDFDLQTNSGSYSVLTVSISNGIITLTDWANPANVLLPVVANHIAQFNGTSGQIYDGSANAIHGGNIQAGLSGTAGTLISYPATASKGSLIVAGVANTGNTNTTISNAAMGQASVISIPDPAAGTADFVLAPSALVSGNIPKASGTAGLIIDSGVAASSIATFTSPLVSGNLVKASGTSGLLVDASIAATNLMLLNAVNTLTSAGSIVSHKVNGTESSNAVTASGMSGVITTSSLTTAAGGSYAITWTNTFISSTSVVLLTISGGSNSGTRAITFICAPGAGTATLTIYNIDALAAISGTLFISYLVM